MGGNTRICQDKSEAITAHTRTRICTPTKEPEGHGGEFTVATLRQEKLVWWAGVRQGLLLSTLDTFLKIDQV